LKGIANHIKHPILKDKLGWKLAAQIVEAGDGSSPGLVNQALMELGATYCAPAGSGIDDRDPLRDYYLSTQLGRAYLAVVQDGGSELIDDLCSPPPSATTPTKTKAESKKKCCEICDSDGIHIVFERFRATIASNVTTMEEAARIGHSTFPTDPPKKDKREEDLAMAVLLNRSKKCDDADPDDSVRYLMVRRPREGLLAGQWEFPNVCVRIRKKNNKKKTDPPTTTKGPKKAERDQALTKFLLQELFLDHPNDEVATAVSNLSRQAETKPLEHIFSHVKHYMWVEVGDLIDIHLGDDDLEWVTASGKEVRWMNKYDMKKVGITSGVKKVLQSVEKSSSSISKSKPKKRKR
jgi:adenine-specific DNA glycosylase